MIDSKNYRKWPINLSIWVILSLSSVLAFLNERYAAFIFSERPESVGSFTSLLNISSHDTVAVLSNDTHMIWGYSSVSVLIFSGTPAIKGTGDSRTYLKLWGSSGMLTWGQLSGRNRAFIAITQALDSSKDSDTKTIDFSRRNAIKIKKKSSKLSFENSSGQVQCRSIIMLSSSIVKL